MVCCDPIAPGIANSLSSKRAWSLKTIANVTGKENLIHPIYRWGNWVSEGEINCPESYTQLTEEPELNFDHLFIDLLNKHFFIAYYGQILDSTLMLPLKLPTV